jgi:mycothiol synthase
VPDPRPAPLLRPLRADDVPAWARMQHAVAVEEGWSEVWSKDELAEQAAASWADFDRRTLAAVLPDGELAGTSWLFAPTGSTRTHVMLDIRAAHWDAVAAPLLDWALERAADERAAGRLPAPDIDTAAEPHMTRRLALLDSRGFAPVRHFFEMERPLDAPITPTDLPDGLRSVGWSDEIAAPSMAAHDEAFRDHWGSSPPTEERWRMATLGSTTRPDLHRFAVTDDGTVAGYLLAGVFSQEWEYKSIRDAWVLTLGTRRAWRGRGVASALLTDVMVAMRDEGFSHASLGVDSESPTGATRLYERHGFAVARRSAILRRPIG